MYLVKVNKIRGLTEAQYFQICELCFFSKKLLQSNMAQQTFPQRRTDSRELNNVLIKVPEENLNLNRKNILILEIIFFKRSTNLGMKINQHFTLLPHGALHLREQNFCSLYNLNYVERSYMSKSRFLDLDFLFVFAADNRTYEFNARKTKSGLYKSNVGKLINADVNQTANILRKIKQRLKFERLCVEFLDNPLRIRQS